MLSRHLVPADSPIEKSCPGLNVQLATRPLAGQRPDDLRTLGLGERVWYIWVPAQRTHDARLPSAVVACRGRSSRLTSPFDLQVAG